VNWAGKARAFKSFVWHNLDAVVVIVVGFGVVGLQIFDNPKQDLIDSAILALLATTAIVLLRDRIGRDDLANLQQLANDAVSDRPYQVVWQRNEWDLKDRDNATIRVRERLRFTRNDVATIAHWSAGDGEDTRNEAKWRRSEGTGWVKAKKIHQLRVRGGEKVIYCFEEEHNRGDMLDWQIERDAVRRFSRDHESVSLRARTNSDHPRVMRILWPDGTRPSRVELRYDGQPARQLSPRLEDDRFCVEEKIPGLLVGEAVEIAWTW
jgi:hypothetical protein